VKLGGTNRAFFLGRLAMADFTSTIKIEDEFSEPLKRLSKAAWDAEGPVIALAKSLTEATDAASLKKFAMTSAISALGDEAKRVGPKIMDTLTKQVIPKFINESKRLMAVSMKTIDVYKKRAIFDAKYYSYVANGYIQTVERKYNLYKKLAMSFYEVSLRSKMNFIKAGAASTAKYISEQKVHFLRHARNLKDNLVHEMAVFQSARRLAARTGRSVFSVLGSDYFARKSNSVLASSANFVKNLPAGYEAAKGKGASIINAAKEEAAAAKEIGKYVAKNKYGEMSEFLGKTFNKQNIKTQFGKFMNSEFVKSAKNIGVGFAKNFVSAAGPVIIQNLIFAVFDRLKNQMIEAFQSARSAIQRSLDEISLSDKFKAMYGENGAVANESAYRLANKIGENATTVGEMSLRSAQQGIGTTDFERIMMLADKIGKLSATESTESAANTLLSNIKSGHDAGSIAQLLGGGEKMERQLRRSGYERALNHGDLNKALSIAEKIAEQAGFTEEKYQRASNSMSQNYKRIENTISNIKRRLASVYAEAIEPTVEKVKEFLESKTFQTVVNIIEKGMKVVGSIVNGVLSSIIDNLHIMGILLGAGLLMKTYLFIKMIGGVPGILKMVVGGLKAVGAKIGLNTILAKHFKAEQWKAVAATKALAALKIVGIFTAASAALAGILYGVYKLTGTTKSFMGWLKGGISALYRHAINEFTHLLIFFDRLWDRIKIFGLQIKQKLHELDAFVFEKVGELLNKIVNYIMDSAPVRWIAKMVGENMDDYQSAAGDWAISYAERSKANADKTAAMIKTIEDNMMQYNDMNEGVQEAYESEGQAVTDWLARIFGVENQQLSESQKISGDTGQIRKYNEQEEELKWMKAFSDRQITSSYSSMTSNQRIVNINGMSQSSLAEMGRRNLSTIPSRAAM
jgi:uncharacterized protein YeeX (DUF496 family)